MLCPDLPDTQYLAATLGDATRGSQEKTAEESVLMRERVVVRQHRHQQYSRDARVVQGDASSVEEFCGIVFRSTQRAIEIGFEIFDVFDTDRNAHESRRDAELQFVGLGNAAVRHRRRMTDQTLDAAQALGQCE